MEVLSEHMCQGWLEGYLLTGRHGFFSCYEAFIHIVDSMVNQHAKWLKTTREIPWRKPIASAQLSAHLAVWRQDHNGFSHQDPGFIDHLLNKKADVVRIYLPPDANTLLSVADHCLRSRNYINLIVAGKQPRRSGSPWTKPSRTAPPAWASGSGPRTTKAARSGDGLLRRRAHHGSPGRRHLLRERIPDLRIRVVNVVDLMTLQPHLRASARPARRGVRPALSRRRPVIFAFHGYPWVIHRLTYRRHNHDNIHVRGYKEEGTTTTPFDMCVLNNIDRFQLTLDAIKRVPRLKASGCRRAVVLRTDSAPQTLRLRKRRRSARNKKLALAARVSLSILVAKPHGLPQFGF
jgi:xylulose-5-phosphate/fructose-6-phosphate phosphoketolase